VKPSILQRLLLLGGACILAVFTAEIALRVSGKALPAALGRADPDLGWSLRPGAEGWSLGEAQIYVKINADGMRDRDHPITKPAGTRRIAVLGDSYADAMNVESDQTFWAELERQAARCRPAPRVEVLNFGVSGYGTGQELLQLKHRVWKYDPDVILLAFYPGNDVFNNHRELNPSLEPEQSPYFHLVGGELVLDDSYRQLSRLQPTAIRLQSFRAALINRIRLLQLVRQVRNNFRVRKGQKAIPVADIEEKMLVPPTDPKVIEAWQVTEALLAEFHRAAQAHGAELWVVVVSMRPQVHPDTAVREAFAKRLGVTGLEYPEQRIVALAEREGFKVIPLGHLMAEHTMRHKVFVNGGGATPLGDGHWNVLGHRIAGELIAARLCTESQKLTRP
jgi:GDSL-like lipase/acylhydrolase family protein